MSKTKGNVIDPIEIIDKYGTDATRFTLAAMAAPGTDIAFNRSRTEGYRAFANKIWNAARFMFMNVDRVAGARRARRRGARRQAACGQLQTRDSRRPLDPLALQPRDARSERALASYRFHEAANRIYDFFWGEFCDWYLELIKPRLNSDSADGGAQPAAQSGQPFRSLAPPASPCMPFITEEIWQAMYDGKPPQKSIALAPYPASGREAIRPRGGNRACRSCRT